MQASRNRVAPIATIAVLVALIAVLGGVVVSQLGSSYADGGVKTVQLSSNDLAAVARKTYLIDCSHQAVARPEDYTLTCGDANIAVDHVAWTTWGGVDAKATARYIENTCEPYCAAGNNIYRSVEIVAHGLKRKAGNAVYTLITVNFPVDPPSWVHGKTTTFDVAPIG
ncbi:MAG TPA: hypothetical protein VN108_10495 [Marmoricola sp.]|nr:hypothetical protein [Marmoricola sp.]